MNDFSSPRANGEGREPAPSSEARADTSPEPPADPGHASLAVVTGRQDLLGLEVSAGRVAYLSYENPNDVQMRFGVAAHRLGIDPGVVGDKLMVMPYHASPEEVAAGLAEMSAPERGGPFSLVIVDTLQAAFDGSDFNQNKEVLDFTKRQRKLTRLPGGPVVVIAAHPIKNADKANLVPYGGGSILNEGDGNLTIWREDDDAIEVHWRGKWRGVNFDPKAFELEITTAPAIVDTKGRPVPTPVLRPLTPAAKAAKDRNRNDQERRFGMARLSCQRVNAFGSEQPLDDVAERLVPGEELRQRLELLRSAPRLGVNPDIVVGETTGDVFIADELICELLEVSDARLDIAVDDGSPHALGGLPGLRPSVRPPQRKRVYSGRAA
jgi:AAA domain